MAVESITLSGKAQTECLVRGRGGEGAGIEGGGAGRRTGSEDRNEGLIRGSKEKGI